VFFIERDRMGVQKEVGGCVVVMRSQQQAHTQVGHDPCIVSSIILSKRSQERRLTMASGTAYLTEQNTMVIEQKEYMVLW